MTLANDLLNSIDHGTLFWQPDLTFQLVQGQISELVNAKLMIDPNYYQTSVIVNRNSLSSHQPFAKLSNGISIELPDQHLETFYKDHGLKPVSAQDLPSLGIIGQLDSALQLLNFAPGCKPAVSSLLKAVQILKQPAPEYDVSYSHPDIPFTIFVSAVYNPSEIEILRLAESVLHESMHLKLSLLEKVLPMVTDPCAQYYSPWRFQERPLPGVLHGMFVFKAVKLWYQSVLKHINQPEVRDFAEWRIECISGELKSIVDFQNSAGLSGFGKRLAQFLLI